VKLHTWLVLPAALALVLLAGCDGGEDPEGPAGPPLLVQEVLPPDGAEGVPEGAVVVVRFERPVDPATVALATLRVVDERSGRPVEGRIELQPHAQEARFVPRLPLQSPAWPYRVELSETVRARDGGHVDLLSSPVRLPSRFVTQHLRDITAPVFADPSLTAEALGPRTVRLRWNPAADPLDRTPQRELAYPVYMGAPPEPVDFAAPVLVADHGATEALVGGLEPDTEYAFVVRARDLAGNEDDNELQALARTTANELPADLTLVFSGDLGGNLEPCG